LLIVDYIFDWARDVYRPAIINELTTLAAGEMQLFDPDIFSTIAGRASQRGSDFFGFSQDSRRISTAGADDIKPASYEPPYTDTRLSLGVVRDASVVESQVLAFHVTEANVEDFWFSLTALDAPNFVVRTMMQYLESSLRVTGDTLSCIQARWTSTDQTTSDTATDEIFYVKMVIFFHVKDDWNLVQQLTYLAISEDALLLLLSRANLPGSSPEIFKAQIRAIPDLEKARVEPFIMTIKRQSIVSNLTAAVGMLCLTSSYSRTRGRIPQKWLLKRSKNLFAGFMLDSSPLILELVHGLYDAHRMLWRGPTGSHLYFSQNRTSQPIHDTEPCMWPRLELLRMDQSGCALVDGLYLSGDGARYCLYIISKYDFGGYQTPQAVKGLSEWGLYYSALQLDPSRRLRECFGHLNRSTKAESFWRGAASLGSLKDWIEGLESHPHLSGRRGESPNSPIMISSGEESEDGQMEQRD
jgi:hypothetical protein